MPGPAKEPVVGPPPSASHARAKLADAVFAKLVGEQVLERREE